MAHTRYMITKTATSDQCSHEFHSCQPTIPSAMNGSAVIVPVAIRSAVSFLTGCTSSRVGLGGSTTSWCVVKSFMLLASLAPRWPCRTLPKEAESRITPATVRPVGGAVAHEVLVSGGSCDLGQLNLPDSQRPSSDGCRQEHMNTLSFSDLGVSPVIAACLAKQGIESPFPVQASVIPDALAGHDLLVKSPTGSGKTLALGIPLIERIEPTDARAAALVLAPTRELASQTVDELRPLAAA